LIYNFYKHYAIAGKRKITGVNRFFPKTPPGVFFATKDAQVYCLQALIQLLSAALWKIMFCFYLFAGHHLKF